MTTQQPIVSKNAPGAGAGFSAIDFGEIVLALTRRWWVIALAVVVVATAAFAATVRQPKVYSAMARIVIDPVLPKVLGTGTDVDDISEQARAERMFYTTQYSIMRSRAVFRDAIARLKLADDAAFMAANNLTGLTGEDALKGIEGVLWTKVQVAPEYQSRIVMLVVEDFDAERAARLANALAQAYIDQTLERRMETNRNASKWLDTRVDEFSARLDSAEKALNDFRQKNMLLSVSLEDRKNMTGASLTELNEKLIEARTRLIALEAERQVLRNVAEKPDADMEAVPRIAKSNLVAQHKNTLAELEKQGADLESRYGTRHPNMVAVQNQIEKVRGFIQREINLMVASLDNEVDEIRRAEASLKAEVQAETKDAMDINSLAVEYNKLTREVATTQQTYEALLKRQTEADLSGLLKSNYARWLETAEPIYSPIRPSVPVNTLLGAILGLILGLAIVVGGALLDNTVHSQADIEDRLQLPFLGLFPSIEKGKEKQQGLSPVGRDLYVLQHPKSTVAECARSVRTNLLFLGTDHPLKRLLLTSAGPAEGKSTTAITMGVTMALAGNRVVILDTDLRRPRLHKTFGVSGEVGLTSVLLETATLDEAIKATEVRGLELLPCGPLPPNPSELLHSERFNNLIRKLEERYDRILFDSPPVNAVTDAAILSQVCDGTILVVKSSRTGKDAVRRAARQLYDVRANILGVILNDVDFEEGSYYRHHYYYYYNRYSYGSDGEKTTESA